MLPINVAAEPHRGVAGSTCVLGDASGAEAPISGSGGLFGSFSLSHPVMSSKLQAATTSALHRVWAKAADGRVRWETSCENMIKTPPDDAVELRPLAGIRASAQTADGARHSSPALGRACRFFVLAATPTLRKIRARTYGETRKAPRTRVVGEDTDDSHEVQSSRTNHFKALPSIYPRFASGN
jgi:hypothetical protein